MISSPRSMPPGIASARTSSPPGEYVSIRDHENDETHTFKVASVEAAR
jgi:hypothetical protein